jgi:hypothetical protein
MRFLVKRLTRYGAKLSELYHGMIGNFREGVEAMYMNYYMSLFR